MQTTDDAAAVEIGKVILLRMETGVPSPTFCSILFFFPTELHR